MFSLQKSLLLDPHLCNGSVGFALCPWLMVCQGSPLLHVPHPVPCVHRALQGQLTPVTVSLVAFVMLNLAPAKSAHRAVVAASIPAQVPPVLGY